MLKEFDKILNEYPEFVRNNIKYKSYDPICRNLPLEIENFLMKNNYDFKCNGRNGAGGYADCPFIRIANTKASPKSTSGLYLVYLFKKDFSGFYLSLNQGTEKLIIEQLEHCSNFIKSQIDNSFSKESIDLASKTERPKNYERANIISKYYSKNNFTEEELENDLLTFSKLYSEIIRINNLENIDYNDFIRKTYSNKTSSTNIINISLPTKPSINYKVETYDVENYLFYGVPGCGKSYKVNDIVDNILNIKPENKFRTTFYYDYTYSDFIGQVTPNSENGNLKYDISAGVFTAALAKAIKLKKNSSTEKVALIIEEINRGNAPAIFGDVFQLLDRNSNGESEYAIKNSIIAQVLGFEGLSDIKIPDNLYIFATMNTSDQNVFPLDTAFKRRWIMKFVDDKDTDDTLKDKYIINLKNNFDIKKQTEIENPRDISWDDFHFIVNKIIEEQLVGTYNSEDKGIGYYFVKEKEFNSIDIFAEKVIQFLWFDVFNLKHEDIFNFSSYRDLIRALESKSGLLMFGNDQKSLFRESCKPN